MKFIRKYLVFENSEPSIVKVAPPPFNASLLLDENQRSRVYVALLFKKLRAMDSAEDAHTRQFVDPSFHFVPRNKMMQIQVRSIFQ